MTDTQPTPDLSSPAAGTGGAASGGGAPDSGPVRTPAVRQGASVLATERGRTAIADTVVEKIAAIAAREVGGVHELGGGVSRAIGALRERIPGGNRSSGQGVTVEVGERQAAVDLELVAEYGVPVHDLAAAVRENVINAIEGLTGLEVTEVNVNIDDIYMGEAGGGRAESRVE